MESRTEELIRKHRHVLSPWMVQNPTAPVIVRSDGSYLFDDAGRRILDFSSGWVATTLGHNNRIVIEAIKEQLDRLCWAPPSMVNDVRAEYGAALSTISPWKDEGCRTHFVTGGGEANDDAIKIARMLTGRGKIMTAYRSYHGATAGSAALTGGKRRWVSEPHTPPGVVRFWAPYPFRSPFYTDDPREETRRALDHLERVIAQENPDRIAAILMEPVVGSDGIIVYPEGYLKGVREIASAHGILLVFDEVMAGFGRVGEAFASIRFGVTPDMITFAKASSAAYVPLGGVMVRESLARHFDTSLFDAGHTHAGHPIAMAAGLGALKAYQSMDLFKKGYEIEGWIHDSFSRLMDKHPSIGDVRGKGAFFGVEMVKDRATREPLVKWQGKDNGVMGPFYKGVVEDGLWVHGKFSIYVIAPPLTISKAEFDEGIAILDKALTRLEGTLNADKDTTTCKSESHAKSRLTKIGSG